MVVHRRAGVQALAEVLEWLRGDGADAACADCVSDAAVIVEDLAESGWVLRRRPREAGPMVKLAIGGRFVCGVCLRWRQSPVHALNRLLGWCPGDGHLR